MKNDNLILWIAGVAGAAYLFYRSSYKDNVFECAKSLYIKQSVAYNEPWPSDADVWAYIDMMHSRGMTDEQICYIDSTGKVPE